VSEHWLGDPGDETVVEETPSDERDEDSSEFVEAQVEPEQEAGRAGAEHAEGEIDVPDDVDLVEGEPDGSRRNVAVVAAKYNGEVVNRLLASALDELDEAGVSRAAVTVMLVPGAFELPLAAMALAKTRRFACVVALGCVVRGETPHFEYISSEAASGLQLAALETGVPVAFGLLTVESVDQAEARVDKGAEAVRSALEMADAFGQLRATAQTPTPR
jgi:6,7-dimethyl-8-ribityllumazine synthase